MRTGEGNASSMRVSMEKRRGDWTTIMSVRYRRRRASPAIIRCSHYFEEDKIIQVSSSYIYLSLRYDLAKIMREACRYAEVIVAVNSDEVTLEVSELTHEKFSELFRDLVL